MTSDLFEELHLRRVINASGTLTVYGQSSALPVVIEAMTAALPHFFEMDVLHARASAAIAAATGAEAGFVTSCAAAGITIAIAACLAGVDPARIAALPDTAGSNNEVIIQLGHCVDYGAPVTQGIRLAGARVKTVGTVNGTPRRLLALSLSQPGLVCRGEARPASGVCEKISAGRASPLRPPIQKREASNP